MTDYSKKGQVPFEVPHEKSELPFIRDSERVHTVGEVENKVGKPSKFGVKH